MGIDIDGKLLIGCPVCDLEIPEEYDCREYVDNLCDEYGMDYASPYYDSDVFDHMVGFKLEQGDKTLDDFLNYIKNQGEKFKEITGIEPKLMGLAHVW
jgi:hypothetical protein